MYMQSDRRTMSALNEHSTARCWANLVPLHCPESESVSDSKYIQPACFLKPIPFFIISIFSTLVIIFEKICFRVKVGEKWPIIYT